MTFHSRDQSIKFDGGKNRLELLPPYALNALGAVLTYGAEKYGDQSWRRVETERYTGALLRHMTAYMDGEFFDEESTLPHLWHVLCNAVFLVELTRKDEQDVLESSMLSGLVSSEETIPYRFSNREAATDNSDR